METTTSAFVHASSRSSAAKSPRITGSNAPEASRPTTSRRSASIGAVKRTRGIGVPDAAAGLGPFDVKQRLPLVLHHVTECQVQSLSGHAQCSKSGEHADLLP